MGRRERLGSGIEAELSPNASRLASTFKPPTHLWQAINLCVVTLSHSTALSCLLVFSGWQGVSWRSRGTGLTQGMGKIIEEFKEYHYKQWRS